MSTIDERLERLVAITQFNVDQISDLRARDEFLVSQIDNLRAITETNSANIAQLLRLQQENSAQILEFSARSEQHQRNFEAVIDRIDVITGEIRGLQTENRRILDHLFGQESA